MTAYKMLFDGAYSVRSKCRLVSY